MTDNEEKMPPERYESDLTDMTPEISVTPQDEPVAGSGGANEPGAPMMEQVAPAPQKKPSMLEKAKASVAAAAKPAPPRKTASAKPSATPAAPAQKKDVPLGPLVSVVTRNEYYRDGFRNLLKVALAEAAIIVGLILCFLFYMNIAQPVDRYFATTADGRIMRLVPLDQPNMTTPALMSWVAQAATDVMTFGFHDYQRRLQDASQHFTRHGWESFTSALAKSRIIEGVEQAQQVVTAAPRSAPVLTQEGVINGRYRWVVELPLMVTYRAGNQNRTDNLNVQIAVERMPSLENPVGVGIEQWIAR